MGVNSSCLTKLVMSRSLYIVTVVTLAATLLQAEDVESNLYSVEPVEPLQGDKVPTAFAVAHPKVAAKVRDASLQSDEESLVASSSSYEEFYNTAYRKMQTLVQSGKKADECIKAAESSISSVLQEFKTTQKMLDNLDDGAKCTKKGQQEIKRAEYRWRKATKILETTNFKRKETDKDSCKKEVTAKEYQKTSLKEYVHAKKVAIELRRQCKCAVINNVHQLVQFSKTLIKVRAKTVVRETVLICIVKAEAKKKSSKSCRSKAISSLEKATMQKLTLKKKVLAPGVASALCGPKEKTRKEKKKKEDKVKETKNKEKKKKEGGSKEGSRKESKGKEARNKVVEERKAKEKKSKELKRKEANAKERKVKDERNSKETRRKESVIKERKTKESISKEKRGKEKNGKEKRGKESKVKEKKEKESTRKIEVAKKEKTTKE